MESDDQDWLAGGNRAEIARDRIYRCAADLFAERGIDGVSVEDVAARAGCSRATLYRHVGGMATMLDGVIKGNAVAIAQRVAAAMESYDGPQRVVETILAAVQAIRADPVFSDALRHSTNNRIREYLTSPVTVGAAVSVNGMAALDDLTAQVTARIVWSLVDYPIGDSAAERRLVEHFFTLGVD